MGYTLNGVSENNLFVLGKAYMSFGDGQFDQGMHLLDDVDDERINELIDIIVKVTSACPGPGENCNCGERAMGAVETFVLNCGCNIQVHWSEVYDKAMEEIKNGRS